MLKSSLAKYQAETMNCQKVKQEAWRNDGILVVTPEQRTKLSELENSLLDIIGKELYGH